VIIFRFGVGVYAIHARVTSSRKKISRFRISKNAALVCGSESKMAGKGSDRGVTLVSVGANRREAPAAPVIGPSGLLHESKKRGTGDIFEKFADFD
jgi:hypothetical protein